MTIDHRLEENNALHHRIARSIIHAQKIEKETWADQLRAALVEWSLHTLSERKRDVESSCRDFIQNLLNTAPVSEFLASEAPDVPVKIREQVELVFSHEEGVEVDAAKWIFGQALAEIVTSADCSVDGFRNAWELVDTFLSQIGYEAYQRHLESRARSAENEQHLLTLFSEAAGAASKNPEGHIHRQEAELYRRIREDWLNTEDPTAIWDQIRGFEFISPEHLHSLHALRGVNRRSFLEIIDSLKSPGMARAILGSSRIYHDFDEILSLLAAAPPTFTAEETPEWTRAISAGLMLEAAINHIESLHQVVVQPTFEEPRQEVSEQFEAEEARPMLARMVGILTERADFRPLGISWLCELVRNDAIRSSSRPGRWAPFRLTCELLAEALTATGVDLGEILQVRGISRVSRNSLHGMAERGTGDLEDTDPWRPNASDALLAACLCRTPDGDAGSGELERFLEEVLLRRDWGLRVYGQPVLPDWRQHQISLLLASSKDPESWFCSMWSGLAQQRRRSREFRHTDDARADTPSQFLATVATGAVDWMLNPHIDVTVDRAFPMWLAVWNSIVPEVIGQSSLNYRDWWRIAHLHAARLPHALRTGNQPVDEQAVYSQVLSHLGGDAAGIAGVIGMLRLNGADPEVIRSAFGNSRPSLDVFLGELLKWHERDGGAARLSPQELESLRKTLAWCRQQAPSS